ncbi:C15 family peptidase [Adhaeribacter soli]|uniref:Uncharacterized protein n=1 Tax=Adhaeribacter soli TaxID=2607655 RepID=A0A5N1IXA5_9BACT|nr:hypothetical protein [Adhaeribacter soli]KAA9338970.1 hypothetical protein F0P94_09270 [Adhaeribacter soli]
MHFFIDHNQLPNQTLADSFGPESNDPYNKFNITTRFQLTGAAKAFACQDSLMIIQQSIADPTLVNVLLKPIEGLKIPFERVKYFIYRGLLKDSFVNGTAITPTSTSSSELISRLWVDWNAYKTKKNQPNLPDPTPQNFGFDNTLPGSLEIENIFDNSQQNIRAFYVKEGEWIGNFGASKKIGFEIAICSKPIAFNLDYLRAENYQIDVSGTSITAFDRRVKKENILSFIDPSAFFGLHYYSGLDISSYTGTTKTTTKKEKIAIYSDLLNNKFATKNRVYLDIRSETGFSYNFYQNYSDTSGNIKFGNSITTPIAQNYEWSGWPIIAFDLPLLTNAEKNNIKINLRIKDNIKPILFFEDSSLLTALIENDLDIKFIDHTLLINSTDWTNDLNFFFPNAGLGTNRNNIAYYIKLHYFKQEDTQGTPITALKKEKEFDNLFIPLSSSLLTQASQSFTHVINPDYKLISGQFESVKFSYVAECGAYYDNNRVAFYSKMSFPNKTTGKVYSQIPDTGDLNGLNLEGVYNKMSFLSRDIKISKVHIQELLTPPSYQKVTILKVSAYNSSPASIEGLFILGIHKDELSVLNNVASLNSVSEFSGKHPKLIIFEDVSPSPAIDKDGKPYKKYKLKVQGLDDNGQRIILAPPSTQNVYVYSTNDFVFTSKAFADAENHATIKTYIPNSEEKIGFERNKVTPGKNNEDFYIDKNPNMKVEVDSFIATLNTINDDLNAYSSIKALVQDSAKDILIESVNSIQLSLTTSNPTPDDRPLYWARNKMQVALKKHPYFSTQFDTSLNPTRGSDLDKILSIFEEKSRNYSDVDFTYANQNNLKKILITGFDPFQLENNINQSNPSGVCAMALHGKTLGIGFVQSMIIPVRYRDFDGNYNPKVGVGNGIIEDYIAPLIGKGPNHADVIITISQSGYGNYNIDRFATINRGGWSDNMGFTRPENSNSVYLNLPKEKDLIWIETTLPKAMVMNGGINQQPDNWKHFVVYAQHYSVDGNPPSIIPESLYEMRWDYGLDNFKPRNPGEILIDTKKTLIDRNGQNNLLDSNNSKRRIIEGSGSNYLSNEIFYRVALARERWNKKHPSLPKFPSGHFHVAFIQQPKRDLAENYLESSRNIYDELTKLVLTVSERIAIGSSNLNNLF